MKAFLLGSTGLLGQAMLRECGARGYRVSSAARQNAPVAIDIVDASSLVSFLQSDLPDVVINCAGLTDIDNCEANPGAAWATNARPLAFLAEWARRHDRPLLHVSTDHYFTDGGAMAHDELAPIHLVNEYARSKYAGEAFALTVPHSLVLRTSIVGIRRWTRPTFAEWAIDLVEQDRPAKLFHDAYTSSIDVASFAKASLDLLEKGARGLYNLAAREIYSKEAFVREVAVQLGRPLSHATAASVDTLSTRRASCLGLDVRRAQGQLGYELPTLAEVVSSVLDQRRQLDRS